MIVVYNADERFAEVFGTSVLSLFENNKDAEKIIVYLIGDHISEASKDKFKQIAQAYGRTIIVLPMPDLNKLAGVDVMIPHYNQMATCGRLFIASLLPETIEKVIYVDSDTVFVDSIKDLWEMDISKYPIGMVDGAQNSTFRTQLGLSPDGLYYNSGLLLVNLEMWRKMNAEKLFLDFIRSQGGYVPFPDEGVLNAVFDGKVLDLPLRYNAYTLIYAFPYKESCYVRGVSGYYTAQEVKEARKHPVMVHFTNNFYMPLRPWVKGCTHPFVQKYLEYRKMTPWKDKPLWDDPRSTIRKMYSQYCYILPKPVSMWMSRMITVYVTPMRHRINKRKALKKYQVLIGGGDKHLILCLQILDTPSTSYAGGAAA